MQIAFLDLGGWDTHVNQGTAKGQLANHLAPLGQGLSDLCAGLGPAYKDTIIVVQSEFGRTAKENGNAGTDHGHGSVYWVMGGALRGGRIAGRQVAVNRATLFQDRDYPVLNDYRAVIGGLLRTVYGLNATQLAEIFPSAPAADLGLL